MKNGLVILCLMTFACAGGSVPVASSSLPREMIEDRWSLHVVTLDLDGDERVTRIWVAVEGGDATIRTNQSRWWTNLERDPEIRIRLSGMDFLFRAEPVVDAAGKMRIDAAFLDKYGGWERMLFPQERGETHVHYARLRAEN